MKIVNFGSINMDYVYHVKAIVQPGETIASNGVDECCGGKGLNQSVALARAGMEVIHAGMIGEDEAGKVLLEMLASAGVHTSKVQKARGKSGHTIIQVNDEGQNSIILFGGANQKITTAYVDEILGELLKGDLLLLQNEISNLSYIVAQAIEKGIRIILNPSPMDDALRKWDFAKFDLLLINEVEGEQLTGEADPEKILYIWKSQYPNTAVVLTAGSKGAYFQKGREKHFEKARKVNVVDTTGAGDTFTGFFVKEYYETGDAARALALATEAAGVAVTRMGAARGIPTLGEVQKIRGKSV